MATQNECECPRKKKRILILQYVQDVHFRPFRPLRLHSYPQSATSSHRLICTHLRDLDHSLIKSQAPRSSVIFKVKKVQFQDARYGMACDVVEMLQDYFSGQLGSQRGYRTDFIIKDEADHHLMYGRVRQKHWWEGTALAPPGQLQPLRNVTSDDDDDNDGWGQYVPVIPAITAANVSDYSSGSDRDGDFFGTNGWYYPLSDEAGFGSVSGPGSGPEAPAQQSSAGLIVPVQSGVPPVHADGHALGNAATEGLQAY